jgi:hypothetical protein
MRLLRNLALGVTFLVIACNDPTSASIASSVSGSWEIPQTVPGSDFWMTLANDENLLSGSGILLVEAGDGGYSTIHGAVDDNVVNLDFTPLDERSRGATTISGHFRGRLILGELRGTMQFGDSPDTSPVPMVFVRKELIPR